MPTMNTSSERIDALMRISDQIYPILEQPVDGEIRARRIVRLGIASAAIALRHGATPHQAGLQFDTRLSWELRSVDYEYYDPYRQHATQPPRDITPPEDLAELANRYSDTLRGTHLANHSQEPDSIHALHLAALATPYARAHYPDLHPGKVALYSLVHDLPEAYTGDTPTFRISESDLQLKKQDDTQAIQALRDEHGKKWPELVDMVEAYETLADDEAAFVKAQDKNDPGYTHFRNDAHSLRTRHGVQSSAELRTQADANTLRTLGYAARFPLVLADKHELTDRIANLFD